MQSFYIILDLNYLKLKKKITNLIKYKLYDYNDYKNNNNIKYDIF